MSRRHDERGIALILVLWVFMTLGVIALDFSRYMRDDAMAAVNFADETRSYYTAMAGMNLAIWWANQQGAICVPPKDDIVGAGNVENDDDGDGCPDDKIVPGKWTQREVAGEGLFAFQVTDEDGRISLNKAPDDVIKTVITNLLLGPDAAIQGVDRREQKDVDLIVDGIRAWKDPSNATASGLGGDHALEMRRRSKVTWFSFNEELLSIPGITTDLFYGNGTTPGLVDVFSSLSKEESPHADTLARGVADALGEPPPSTGTTEVHLVRIRACADIRKPRNQARIEAVVHLDTGGGTAPRVVRWIDRAPLWNDPDACKPAEPPA